MAMLRLYLTALLTFTWSIAGAGAVEREVSFPSRGEDGVILSGRLHVPAGATGCPGVVLVHPDPRFGGSMDVAVTVGLQEAFEASGFATLRFNLRGVGASTGKFDNGEGEMRDCLGALDFLRKVQGVDPRCIALAGYSFGSWVGLRACVVDRKVRGCACLAFPVPEGEDPERHPYFREIKFPALFVTGTADPISDLGAIRRIIARHEAGERCTVTELAGADHFFWQQEQLGQAVRAIHDFVKRVCCAPPEPVEGEGVE
ncbi:MAG: alpha/beta fold hydrolase [Armatimonadetes bacterium]|nr:alpha/beta fold hydrolase [Armatimonadota bacterium]